MLLRYSLLIIALILLCIGFGPPRADAQAQGAVSGRVTEAETRYQRSTTRYDRHVIYGRTFTLGVATRF